MRARRSRSRSAASSPSPSRCSWPTQLVERARAHPHRERRLAGGHAGCAGRVAARRCRTGARHRVSVWSPRQRRNLGHGRGPAAVARARARRTRRSSCSRELIRDRHRQPARQRAPAPGAARRDASRGRLRVRAAGRRGRAPEPGRRLRGEARGPDAVPARPRRHGPRRARRSGASTRGRRRRRRRGPRPRRAGHEGPGRGRGRPRRSRSAATAGARRGRAAGRHHRRRGGGRRPGAKWLCEEHPDEGAQPTSSSTRAAAPAFELDGRRFYTLCVGEKGVCRFLLRARGAPATPRCPALGDNALLKLAPLLERAARAAAARADRRRASPSSRRCSSEDLDGAGPRRARRRAVERLRERSAAARRLPRRADAAGDAGADHGARLGEGERDPVARRGPGRLPRAAGPGRGRGARARSSRARRRGRAGSRSSSPTTSPATARRPTSPLADAIAAWLAEADPGAGAGADRDARLHRQPLVPQGVRLGHRLRLLPRSASMALFEAAPLVHGADERAAVADVELAAASSPTSPREVLG